MLHIITHFVNRPFKSLHSQRVVMSVGFFGKRHRPGTNRSVQERKWPSFFLTFFPVPYSSTPSVILRLVIYHSSRRALLNGTLFAQSETAKGHLKPVQPRLLKPPCEDRPIARTVSHEMCFPSCRTSSNILPFLTQTESMWLWYIFPFSGMYLSHPFD